MAWNGSQYTEFRADPSLRSVLFTLGNRRGGAPLKFPLKPEEKERAINCRSGPSFGEDLILLDCFLQQPLRASKFGTCYMNHMNFDSGDVFRGSAAIIEVFKITD